MRRARRGGAPGTTAWVVATGLLTSPALFAACSGSGNGASAEVAPPAATASSNDAGEGQDRPPPGQAWVIFGADTVRADVASTPEAREQGLMGRLEVPPGTGMLFVFPDNELRSFWMKDTFVSLDIAFFDAAFQVVDIKQMEAEDTNLTDAEAPSSFALEVIQGWLAEHDVQVGDTARIVFGPGLRVR